MSKKYYFYLLQVYIEVLDENDNIPLTELPVYYPAVPENSPAGVNVVQIRAFDRDVSSQQFTFSITSGNPEGYFLINSTTGKCHLSQPHILFFIIAVICSQQYSLRKKKYRTHTSLRYFNAYMRRI